MKKILSAIIMTALVSLGLVAVSSGPANAACPYTACINTVTSVKTPAQRQARKAIPVKVTVTAPGNVVPNGIVTVAITKNGKGVYQSSQPYAGGRVTFVTQSLRKGTYNVTAYFTANPSSVFNSSSATTSFIIKKRKRR